MRKFILFSMLLLPVCFAASASAQSDEERNMLELYYEKKDLVVTPTRHPKPISQVAENISIVYAEDIEAMNAHTVAEALRLVPGVQITSNRDFGASSLIGIEGSEDRHVLVLLDGIPWNYFAGGNAETNTIPVGIIDRIEVIKGPASSAWGSSLGGVVNIITKQTGYEETPHGNVSAAYGEGRSLDASTQIKGKVGSTGYYLYAGKQESDGLSDNQAFDTLAFFGKANVAFSRRANLSVSAGGSRPDNDFGAYPSQDIQSDADARTSYANSTFTLDLPGKRTLSLTGFYLSKDTTITSDVLGLGFYGAAGDLFSAADYTETAYGAGAKFSWEPKNHVFVAGVEANRGDLDQSISTGPALQAYYGAPALSQTHPDMSSWAAYANDTILLGRWAVTPGARFDHNSVGGSLFSPSFGVTFQPKKVLLFRGSLSRGFQYAPLSASSGGGLFYDPNPDLEAETVWAYQAGMETTAIPGVRVKTTLFLYDVDNFIERIAYAGSGPAYNDLYMNTGGRDRRGVELEATTEPVRNFSLGASGTYVKFDQPNGYGASETWIHSLILSYDAPRILRARLMGHFEALHIDDSYGADTDDMIWDLALSRPFPLQKNRRMTLFVTGHNLFDGNQYTSIDTPNPSRWIEAGMRFAY